MQGYSHLGHESTIPSARSSQCNSLNTTYESVGLSNLCLGSNGSEPNTPMTQYSNAQGPQPGDKDNTRRLIIEPVGNWMCPDEGMAGIILKCIGTHYNDLYLSWSKIPINAQGQMFKEFKERFMQKVQDYRSTLSLESQDTPLTQELKSNYGEKVWVNQLEGLLWLHKKDLSR